MSGEFTPEVYEQVRERSGGMCEVSLFDQEAS
jgi:hypothetical protein